METAPFFDVPEGKKKGSGGLLSITVNPDTCKGCDICVAVCADGALKSVRQTEEYQETLESNWKLWRNLPETDDSYIKISSLDEGIGVMSSLLLKQSNYMSMTGGDGACMGCGEKTTIHLPLKSLFVTSIKAVLGSVDTVAFILNSGNFFPTPNIRSSLKSCFLLQVSG